MEAQREDVNGLLAHLAKELEIGDDEPYEIASTVASMMYEEFKRNGIKEQIDMAISFAQISLRYEHHKPEITNRLLSNLGALLGSRYERTREIIDLEEAIQVARQAVASTPEDHSNLASYLNNLGNWLGSRYERTRDMTDLEEAIQIARQAVASTPEDHSDLAGPLNNLGNWLGSRYEQTGDMTDLEEAIQVARRAIASIPEDHSNLATCLNSLGNRLGSRYKRTGDMTDLEEAI